MAENLARTTPHWRKSSRSGAQNNCVEAATNLADRVLVRDSKDVAGPVLAMARPEWSAFVAALRAGNIAS